MAPFNTHFLVAEKIWPELDGPWQPHYYGQFCFGCIAPDVDKVSAVLTQRDTHFFDRFSDYGLMASHRTATFLERQAEFLRPPFAQLKPEAQAFVLGFLCHLCVDEVSKYMWRRTTWMQFFDIGPGPAFAALDELAQQRIQNYAAIVSTLAEIEVLEVIPVIPRDDLAVTLDGVRNFVRAPTPEEEYLALIDLFDKPSPQLREQKRQDFRVKIDTARERVHGFKLDTLVEASLNRTRQRFDELLSGRVAEPSNPVIR